MTESMQYTRAVPFSRPAGRRRIEVFSAKIGRRLSLGGYNALRTWLVIEANPHIVTFCERPTHIDGPRGPLIDFWVQLRGELAGQFWPYQRLLRRLGWANVEANRQRGAAAWNYVGSDFVPILLLVGVSITTLHDRRP